LSSFGLLFVFGAADLCVLTKNNTWLAIPLLLVVLLFTLLRARSRALPWALFLVIASIGLGAVFFWGDAALWYRRTTQTIPTRVVNSLSPLGEHAFQLEFSLQNNSPSIVQPLPPITVVDLRNSPVTLGAWIWSSRPMGALIQLYYDGEGQLKTFSHKIKTGTEPGFYFLTATLPANANHVSVGLAIPAGSEEMQGNVFYDGLVLVKGERLAQDPPRFYDQNGRNGIWAGLLFSNLLRNPSAEQTGPGFQSWANKIVEKIMPRFTPSFTSDILVSLLDWKGAGWYYRYTSATLLRTFWAKFGWGNVPLLGSKPYRVLAVVTLLGMAGSAWAIWQRRHTLPWEVILLLGLALLGIWIQAIERGLGSLFDGYFFPGARYAFPAILPTVLLLNAGWLEVLRKLGRWLRMDPKIQSMAYLLLFAMLDVLSILSIARFYYMR
jgi:hypothetical protein